MTDEKYIQNQKNFIKREQKSILRDHWTASWLGLLLIAILIVLLVTQVHPDHWQETTISLDHYQIVHTVRAGHRLDIYATDGTRYVMNRKEYIVAPQLVRGQEYTFLYADGLLHNQITVFEIDGTQHLRHEDSVKYYRLTKSILWVMLGIFFAGLVAVNFFFYKTISCDKIKKIRKYQQRICDKKAAE